jgi:NAD(P)-dependent dehydrogenase (short-subunit alcohol dehydrogenase family)
LKSALLQLFREFRRSDEEIAQAVIFLCSDAASYITGQPFAIDDGYMAN